MKIRVAITSVDEALEALLLMGWEPNDEDELILPMDIKLSFPEHVKAILEAKQVLKKKEENDRVERGLSRIAPTQVAKEKAANNKSAFQFQDRRVKEKASARADENLARLRKEKQEQFELNTINAHGQLPQPGNNIQHREAANRIDTAASSTAPVSPDIDGKKVKSAFQFESRAKKEDTLEKSKGDANDIRALQKAKYQNFKQDPNAYNNQTGFYSGGSSTTTQNNNNGGSSSSWWDPTSWFGGGSNPPPPPRGGGNERRGPRVKTMSDMPKPVRRG